MAFARARAVQTFQSSLRYSGRRVVPRVSAPGRTQLVQRRYASGSEGHTESGSDLPWALAAVVVTIPSCWYLWPDSSHADAGHHGGHGEDDSAHGGTHDEQQDEALKDQPSDTPEPDGEEGGEAKEEDEKLEKEEEEKQDSEPTKTSGDAQDSEPPGGEDSKEKEEGGKDESGSKDQSEDMSDSGEDKSESEGKDESQGEDKSEGKSDSNEGESSSEGSAQESQGGSDKSRSTKKLDDTGKHVDKENTGAKHSSLIGDDSSKSHKAEGSPETAKKHGTVQPDRPQK